MSKAKLEGSFCYYVVLELCKEATASDIREAYRRLALKWHPDRWMRDPKFAGEAKKMFQKILEAYSVLSDKKKRRIYDAGLFGLLDDDDDQDFCDFMQEMVSLMQNETSQGKNNVKDLKRLFGEMMAENENENERAVEGFDFECNTFPKPTKRSRTFT